MTTQQLLALDLLAVVLSAALFFAAGAAILSLTAKQVRGAAVTAAICASLGLLATVGRLVIVVLLLGRGWWFAGEKIVLSAPVAVLTAGFAAVVAGPMLAHRVAGPVLARAARGPVPSRRVVDPAGRTIAEQDQAVDRTDAGAALLIAGYGAAAGVLVTFAVGYPLTVGGVAMVLGLLVGISGLTWLGVTKRRRPGFAVGFVLLLLVPVLTGATAFYQDLQPALIGAGAADHGHLAAPSPGNGSPGPGSPGNDSAPAISVADLRTPAQQDRPVRSFTLTAERQAVTLPSGRTVDAWTFGSLPGPEIRVRQGDLVEVTLRNSDIDDGVTLHWHGYRVPNGEDGVAGVTQDAVPPGGSFTYRFVARDTGTYWYHAHQVSAEAVTRGLFGSLVVEPADSASVATDLVVPVHTIDGITMVRGTDRVDAVTGPVGGPVRLRLVNTDSVPHRISVVGSAFTVAAVDGTDLNGPTPMVDQILRVPAGGRYDVAFTMPDGPVAVGVEGAPDTGLWLAPHEPTGPAVAPFVDGPELDLLSYGTPGAVPGMTGAHVDREQTLVLDRELRFLGGIPTFAQTINGDVHPHVTPITVRQGDLLRLTVVNRSTDTHPMHPHGHRVLVESRDGVPVAGSPIWLDTFDVRPGEVWVVLLRADNPGIWLAHCHNLEHATQGMVVHLAYEGVATPFVLGGPADNRPE